MNQQKYLKTQELVQNLEQQLNIAKQDRDNYFMDCFNEVSDLHKLEEGEKFLNLEFLNCNDVFGNVKLFRLISNFGSLFTFAFNEKTVKLIHKGRECIVLEKISDDLQEFSYKIISILYETA